MLKVPKINWIPFDKENPPTELCHDDYYLILLREDDYDDGATWRYSVDIAEPYGSYLDNFWTTCNDWDEGQRIEVLAYAEFPCGLKESELVNVNDDPFKLNLSPSELEDVARLADKMTRVNIMTPQEVEYVLGLAGKEKEKENDQD